MIMETANPRCCPCPATTHGRILGEISHNRLEFTHCRLFSARSTIDFEPPDPARQTPRLAVASIDDTLRPLPSGLRVDVALRTRISGDLAVGALLEGAVVANVPAKGPVVIPAGSAVRGRLRRLERHEDPRQYFVVALEFTEVEVRESATASPPTWSRSRPTAT